MGASFIYDVHIPPKLADFLRAEGHDAVHVLALGLGEAEDVEIWNYAAGRDAIIITKDDDFVGLSISQPGPRVVYVRLGNCPNAMLLRRFEESLAQILEHFDAGIRLVELTW